MKKTHKGFGPEPVASERTIKAIENLPIQMEKDLKSLLGTPEGRGLLDAFIEEPSKSNDPAYQHSYNNAMVTKLQMKPHDQEAMRVVIPFIKHLLMSEQQNETKDC